MKEEDEESEFELLVEWDSKREVFIGTCPQFPDLEAEGDTEEEALEEIGDMVEFFADIDEDDEDEDEKYKNIIKEKNIHMIVKTKKRIGIPVWSTGENSMGVGKNHLDFIKQFGIPRWLDPEEEFVDEVDLLYLPGGADINPASYGEVPSVHTGNPDVFKQFFFDHRLKAYIDAGKAVFGVCLGSQQLAVYFGSKLAQHLPRHDQSPARWRKGHKVYQPGEDRTNKDAGFDVNSHHHQAVTLDLLSDQLVPLMVTDNDDVHVNGHDDIVEAFRHETLPIVGIQWHPEEWQDDFSIQLMNELLED